MHSFKTKLKQAYVCVHVVDKVKSYGKGIELFSSRLFRLQLWTREILCLSQYLVNQKLYKFLEIQSHGLPSQLCHLPDFHSINTGVLQGCVLVHFTPILNSNLWNLQLADISLFQCTSHGTDSL